MSENWGTTFTFRSILPDMFMKLSGGPDRIFQAEMRVIGPSTRCDLKKEMQTGGLNSRPNTLLTMPAWAPACPLIKRISWEKLRWPGFERTEPPGNCAAF